MQREKIPLSQVEPEDVIAIEAMDNDMVKKYGIKRLATESEIKRLKSLKIKELWVYTKLPAFLPFLCLGVILALFLSKNLILFQ